MRYRAAVHVFLRLLIAVAITLPASTFADEPPGPEAPPTEPAQLPAPTPPQPIVTEPPQTTSSVASAPLPEAAGAQVRAEDRSGEWALWIPRTLLFPIRVAVAVVGWPISKGLRLLELYNLSSKVKSVFFNEDDTVAVFPVAFAETGFGLNIGGRLILRRLGGTDLGITARASFGGRFRQLFSTKLSTNKTFEHVVFDLRSSYEVRPKDQFFGIGNGDLLDAPPPMAVDARGNDLRASRFRQDALRVSVQAAYRPMSALTIALSGAIIHRTFGPGEGDLVADQQLAANFDVTTVNRFIEGSSTTYGELEMTYDARRTPSRFESLATPSAGWLLQGFAGYTRGFDGDPSRYVRYGLDLQRFLRIEEGPRSLALRLHIEGVTGGYQEVSFYDLPKLGGPLLLRGYNLDQYRDRFAALSSVEYQFDTTEFMGGFLFADVGRVYSQPEDISLADLRLGFGGGIQLHSKKSFIGRFTIASSTQRDVFLSVSLDPIYDTRARVERR